MKHLFLLTTIIALTLGFSAKAQFGGEDVLVSEGTLFIINESKISVADNGWMYILTHYHKGDYSESSWKLFRSKDNGIVYEELREFKKANYNLKSCDLVVTGTDESDINVWIGMVLENPVNDKASVYVAQYKHDGTWIKNAHSAELSDTKLYHCAISADYRSPSVHATGFFISLAYTGYYIPTNNSYVDYVVSQNAGENFTKTTIYKQAGEGNLGRIDLSIGLNKLNTWAFVGIVFEMDKTGENKSNIGFLANYADYDPDYKWAAPVKVNMNYAESEDKCGYPKIQWMLNQDTEPTNPNLSSHNFLISFHEWGSGEYNYDLDFIYPENTFKIDMGHTPVLDDFGIEFIVGPENQLYPDLAYDKASDHYLLTYIDEKDAMYKYIDYNNIDDPNGWNTVNNGVYSTTPDPPFLSFLEYKLPVVDIHPVKVNACFAWTQKYVGNTFPSITYYSTFADTEWSELAPPPPSGTPYITLTTLQDSSVNLDFVAPADDTPVWIEAAPNKFIKIIVDSDWFGFEYYTVSGNTLKVYGELKGLDCEQISSEERVIDIDLSHANKNALEILYCGYNLLTTLDLGGLTNLTELFCYVNQLTTLDVSTLTKLERLGCGENKLTTLNLGKLAKLYELKCEENQLTSLNVSELKDLMEFWCWSNNFTTAALDKIYCDLPLREPADYAEMVVLYNNSDPNQATVLATNKKNAENKNWKVVYADHSPIPTTGTYDCDLSAEIYNMNAVEIYPNPATNLLNIKAEDVFQNIAVYDILGRKLISKETNSNTATLDISTLNKGAYILKLYSSKGIGTYKVIKE